MTQVLIVYGNISNAAALAAALREDGISEEVEVCGGGSDLMDALSEGEIPLAVLVGFQFQFSMTGDEITESLRDHRPEIFARVVRISVIARPERDNYGRPIVSMEAKAVIDAISQLPKA